MTTNTTAMTTNTRLTPTSALVKQYGFDALTTLKYLAEGKVEPTKTIEVGQRAWRYWGPLAHVVLRAHRERVDSEKAAQAAKRVEAKRAEAAAKRAAREVVAGVVARAAAPTMRDDAGQLILAELRRISATLERIAAALPQQPAVEAPPPLPFPVPSSVVAAAGASYDD